jgi:hypothetical protein
MKKRDFLVTAGLAAALPLAANAQPAKGLKGPALLTVTGAITNTNRGSFDGVLDQMMAKQKLAFDKAHAFDFASLAAMPAVTLKPTLEYDKKPQRTARSAAFDGAAGRRCDRHEARDAIDGYAPVISVADVQKYRFIVATHLDGQPMPLGGFGPLWAIYEADKFADMAAKPLDQRFANCPWGLYHMDVQA